MGVNHVGELPGIKSRSESLETEVDDSYLRALPVVTRGVKSTCTGQGNPFARHRDRIRTIGTSYEGYSRHSLGNFGQPIHRHQRQHQVLRHQLNRCT